MKNPQIESRLTNIDSSYPSCERTSATLKVYPEICKAEEITRLLDLLPSEVQEKGEVFTNSLGRTREAQRSAWFLSSENKVQSLDLRHHLDWLINKLEFRKDHLLELQRQEGVLLSVGCVWWSAAGSGGPTLWPEQMAGLSSLNLECSFDVYFFDTD